MVAQKQITGIILAGGKSSRMGQDKGFLMHQDITFIQRIINALKPISQQLLIVGDNPNYDSLGITRISDQFTNSGPLSGLYSGLNASKTEYNLVLSCDVPLVNSDMLLELIPQDNTQTDAVIYTYKNRKMPLIGYYNKKVVPILENELQHKRLKLTAALDKINYRTIEIPSKWESAVKNINTPEDLAFL